MKILQINSSLRGDDSASSRLASRIVARLRALDPASTVEIRDLSSQPFLDMVALTALTTPPAKRTPAQAARVALDDATIAQLMAADVIVLGVPLYNLGEPAQLKAWLDAICRANVTFRYTPDGPEGLVKGKKVFGALTRGGIYRDTDLDTQTPYLRNLLGFLGMTDVTFVYAEGLELGPEQAASSIAAAEQEIDSLDLGIASP